jgi:lysophospholipase L1-like esterase
VTTLVFFGNSLVEGRYGGDVVAATAAHLPGVTVINAGQAGNTILNLLERLERDVLVHEPDRVVILAGGNDAISYSQPFTRRYYQQVQNVPGGVVEPAAYRAGCRDLLTRLQLAHTLPAFILAPLEYNPATAAAMRDYNTIAREEAMALNIPLFDLESRLQPAITERPPLDQATINWIGQRMAVGWADYDSAQQAGGFSYTFDGLHLTPSAAVEIGGWLAAWINTL